MDPFVVLLVRFYFSGEFVYVGRQVSYVGGDKAMSYIERDKIIWTELKAHLSDHTNVTSTMRFQWHFPGIEISQGLRLLVRDNTCLFMSERITIGRVTELYVEDIYLKQILVVKILTLRMRWREKCQKMKEKVGMERRGKWSP